MSDKAKLATAEGEIVEVDKEIACHSVLIRGIIEDSGIEDEIPLPQIKKPILEKILDYCKHIQTNAPPEIDKPLRSNQLSDVVNEYYAGFVNVE